MGNHLRRKHFSVYTENYPEKRIKCKTSNIVNDVLTERINEENIDESSTSGICEKQTSDNRYKSLCINDAFNKISYIGNYFYFIV